MKLSYHQLGKRIHALSLSLLMLLGSGCGQANENEVSVNSILGCYVENVITTEGASNFTSQLYKQSTGELAFYDFENNTLFKSSNQGTTWSSEVVSSLENPLKKNCYIDHVAIGQQGEFLAEYVPNSESTSEDSPTLLFQNGSGEVTLATFGRNTAMAGKLAIDSNGTPYLCENTDNTIYRLDFTDETMETVLAANGEITGFDICGTTAIVVTPNGIQLYDLVNNQPLSDPATLNDFIKERGIGTNGCNLAVESVFFVKDPTQDALYLLCGSGIYHYVLGGSCVEQLVDNSSICFQSPNNQLRGFSVTDNGNFFVLGSESGLRQLSFDSAQTIVISKEITIYSLYSNITLRQAIAQFKLDHPEVEVTYEVGIQDIGSITYEDAIKNLNTEIMAGEGPDLIMMDRLSMNDYVENGLLLDLSKDSSWRPTDALFDSVVSSMTRADGLYAIPTKVSIPVLFGSSEINNVTNLTELADLVESYHATNPEQDIFQYYQPETLLQALFLLSPESLGNDKELTRDELVTFLTQAKRIYDVQMATLPANFEPMTDEEQNELTRNGTTNAEDEAESLIAYTSKVSVGGVALGNGNIGGILYDYHMLPSAQLANETFTYTCGLSGADNYYKPSCMLAVCSTSTKQDVAMQFIQTALSTPVQSIELGDGLPINQTAFTSLFVEGNSEHEQYGTTTPLGADHSFAICYCNQDEYLELETMMDELTTPIQLSEMVKNSILEMAPAYLSGAGTLDETADAIMEKIELRLAE